MSDDEQQVYPWKIGSPIKPDVDSLMKAYPPESIQVGWLATDEELRSHIGACGAQRFYRICDGFVRRMLREHQIVIFRRATVGLFRPSHEEIFARTHPTYEHAGRALRKHMRNVASAQPTDDLGRAVQDHHGKLLYASTREMRKARMNALPSTKMESRPQLPPPGSTQLVSAKSNKT
jgi:nucleotidyltransferase/DNA polymerase involved in DNA repair